MMRGRAAAKDRGGNRSRDVAPPAMRFAGRGMAASCLITSQAPSVVVFAGPEVSVSVNGEKSLPEAKSGLKAETLVVSV